MNIRKIIRDEINESIKLPIEIGDTVYMGRFKNKKVIVKDIKWNKKGDLMINGKSALRVRIPKKKSINEGTKYEVFWVDRDYKSSTKDFYDNPQGAPENGLKKAKMFLKKLEDKDKKDKYGLYRDLGVRTISEAVNEGISKYERVKKELEENGVGSMVCFGQSMFPIIKSGSVVTFIKQNSYEVGDIVFCVVNNYWVDAHIITKKDPQLGFLITDNHGSDDGWTNIIFGKAVQSNWGGQLKPL